MSDKHGKLLKIHKKEGLSIYPSKKIIVVSHCVLNQNAVVHGLERAKGAFPLVEEILKRGIGIIQLPCPEFLYLGSNRPSMNKAEYEKTEGYAEHCRRILEPVFWQLEEYQKNGYSYIGVLGIQESPSCSLSSPPGILMEKYMEEMERRNWTKACFEVPVFYDEEEKDGKWEELRACFVSFLEEKQETMDKRREAAIKRSARNSNDMKQ